MDKHLTWYNIFQYVAMLLMAAAIPVGMHVALWASCLLALASLVAMVAGRHVGNPSLLRGHRWGLLLIVGYWVLLLISMLWTTDYATGWDILKLKAVLLIFSLSFLLTDTGWITPKLLSGVGYAFLAAMTGVFLYYSGVAVGKMIGGASLGSVTGNTFDPRHHAYTAIYLAVALAFIYNELHDRWSEMHRWLRAVMIAVVPLLILYIIIVNSRAGMLMLYIIEAVCVVHFALTLRRWRWAALMAVLLAGYTFGMEKALPTHQERVVETIADLTSDEPSDARVDINGGSLDAVKKQPLIGYGVGDYRRCLVDQYDENGWEYGVGAEFNAHNQYMETMLSVGAIGLLLFLAMGAWPLWQAWRGRSKTLWLILLLTFIVAFNLLFESMLERQMGLLFIGPLLVVMTLTVSCEENKFGQLPKK
ncbi:MAG: O-antigen ligase family protein [Bacteroidales bacterium]|nr:O-antigen ligase family protein [Bacteroidales bacterium]